MWQPDTIRLPSCKAVTGHESQGMQAVERVAETVEGLRRKPEFWQKLTAVLTVQASNQHHTSAQAVVLRILALEARRHPRSAQGGLRRQSWLTACLQIIGLAWKEDSASLGHLSFMLCTASDTDLQRQLHQGQDCFLPAFNKCRPN